jgi:hypothetical protein
MTSPSSAVTRGSHRPGRWLSLVDGVVAWCSRQQWCCQNGEGLSSSNAAHGDKLAIDVGCRARHGLQVEGDA